MPHQWLWSSMWLLKKFELPVGVPTLSVGRKLTDVN